METFKINKGLDINIPGVAEKNIVDSDYAKLYAVKPSDYIGMVPRLLVSEGDKVMAATPLLEDKRHPGIPFVSPVSGTVHTILRGEKRALLAVVVECDGLQECVKHTIPELTSCDSSELRTLLIHSGLWTLLRQRPFGIVPPADANPKAVFVSGFDNSPLAVDADFVMKGREEDFQKGISVLAHLVGKVHLSLDGRKQRNSFMANIKDADIHFFEGKHPASLTGTQIAKIDPINKGETVWTVNFQDVAVIGHFFRTGEYRPERVVAICGPMVNKPHYIRTLSGAAIQSLNIKTIEETEKQKTDTKNRFICGSVLSGTAVDPDDFLCASCDKVCVLPEGDYYDFLGWLRPNFKKYSFSHTFLSGILSKFNISNSKSDFDTGMHGSRRPLFVTGEFEKLTPLDIYPMQLIKACIIGDIELMENLGIYEVEPEDLALCEFADTSKTEIQAIIRNSLEKLRIES